MSRADATRDRILEATRSLLEAGEPVSMGRIASAAGVTRQLLYLRFEGRGDLLLQVARRVDEEARTPRMQARIDDAPDGRTALRESIAVQGEIKPAIEAVVRVMHRLEEEDEEIAAALREREEARLGRVREVIDRLDDEGSLAAGWSAASAADLVWALTSQRSWRQLVVDRGWTTAAWAARTTAAAEAAIIA